MNTDTKTRVSEYISDRDIESWDNEHRGKAITIRAGCGRGKSYFVKNNLYEKAKAEGKKILLLVHRTNCLFQFAEELKRDNKTDVIDVCTYQGIEWGLLYKRKTNLSRYKYIVADEFHYFLNDSAFNNSTDISLESILNQPETTVKIFMSATCADMIEYISDVYKLETKDYSLPEDFTYIRNLTFFHADESMEKILEDCIETGEKAMFFIQSAKKAYRLYLKYKDHCLFNCSKSNAQYYKHVDSAKVESMLNNEKFDEQFLISTTCFDAGANILDRAVKHIIIDVVDISSLIQCIGRRRILDDSDTINVFIKSVNNQRLGGIMRQTQKNIEMAEFLNSHSVAQYIDKHPRKIDYASIIYDETLFGGKYTKKVNRLMYRKKQNDIKLFQDMIENYKTKANGNEFGYCKYLAQIFGFYDGANNRYTYDIRTDDTSLEAFLENIVGKPMLQVKDRKELIEAMDVRADGKRLKSLKTLNDVLEEKEIPYRIIEKSISEMIDGKQKQYRAAWIVQRLNDC